jgi:hypothetical protein
MQLQWIEPADVQELVERGAEAAVLAKGMWERLTVCSETMKILAKNGIKVEILKTEAAASA